MRTRVTRVVPRAKPGVLVRPELEPVPHTEDCRAWPCLPEPTQRKSLLLPADHFDRMTAEDIEAGWEEHERALMDKPRRVTPPQLKGTKDG